MISPSAHRRIVPRCLAVSASSIMPVQAPIRCRQLAGGWQAQAHKHAHACRCAHLCCVLWFQLICRSRLLAGVDCTELATTSACVAEKHDRRSPSRAIPAFPDVRALSLFTHSCELQTLQLRLHRFVLFALRCSLPATEVELCVARIVGA